MQKLNIDDIARLAFVSRSVVSRVLNKRPNVSTEARDRLRYGIHWVAYRDDSGQISFRKAPINPAGRIRKLLPPDSLAYSILMRSQLIVRVKGQLNKMLTGVRVKQDGTTEWARREQTSKAEIPTEQVIVSNVTENEHRYAALLGAFARHLHRREVRFLFMTDDESCYGSELLSAKIKKLAADGLLEWLPISRSSSVPRSPRPSAQGQGWHCDPCCARPPRATPRHRP